MDLNGQNHNQYCNNIYFFVLLIRQLVWQGQINVVNDFVYEYAFNQLIHQSKSTKVINNIKVYLKSKFAGNMKI